MKPNITIDINMTWTVSKHLGFCMLVCALAIDILLVLHDKSPATFVVAIPSIIMLFINKQYNDRKKFELEEKEN